MKTNRPTGISVSYLCHSESSQNSGIYELALINVFMYPFILKPDRKEMNPAFPC